MATQTYVGARYVPKFMGEYDSSTVYEALSVVDNGSGTSYISKIPTPANTPLTDTTHWALYGASSGAIFDLQTRMTEAEGDITDIQSAITGIQSDITGIESDIDAIEEALDANEVILIGDSYAVDETIGHTSWASIVESVYSSGIYRNTVGGTGFGSDVYIQQNWLSMLQELAASVTNKNSVKKIICMGGANDANLIQNGTLSTSTLASRINAFCSYAAETFPHATVCIAFVGWNRNYLSLASYVTCRNQYSDSASKNPNAMYFTAGEAIMHNNANINTSDNVHPLTNGSKALGEFALCIINGSDYVYNAIQSVTITPSSGVSSINNLAVSKCKYKGNNALLSFVADTVAKFVQVILSAERTAANVHDIEVGTIVGSPVGGPEPVFGQITVSAGSVSNGTKLVSGILMIQGNKLYIRLFSNENFAVKAIAFTHTQMNILLCDD